MQPLPAPKRSFISLQPELDKKTFQYDYNGQNVNSVLTDLTPTNYACEYMFEENYAKYTHNTYNIIYYVIYYIFINIALFQFNKTIKSALHNRPEILHYSLLLLHYYIC